MPDKKPFSPSIPDLKQAFLTLTGINYTGRDEALVKEILLPTIAQLSPEAADLLRKELLSVARA